MVICLKIHATLHADLWGHCPLVTVCPPLHRCHKNVAIRETLIRVILLYVPLCIDVIKMWPYGLYKQNRWRKEPSVINKKPTSTGLYQVIHIKQYPKAPMNLDTFLPPDTKMRTFTLAIFPFALLVATITTVNSGKVILGPGDVGAQILGPADMGLDECPEGSYLFMHEGEKRCCCQKGCCMSNCQTDKVPVPPESCLANVPGGATWKLNKETGNFQATRCKRIFNAEDMGLDKCPEGSKLYMHKGEERCCCGYGCCMSGCRFLVPPESCLANVPGGARWRMNSTTGQFQAITCGKLVYMCKELVNTLHR